MKSYSSQSKSQNNGLNNKPIIGEVYREIVGQIYNQNLLIKNETLIGNDSIDLSNITMPVLNIVGKKDDLVRPHSSKSTLDAIESKDKNFQLGMLVYVSASKHTKNCGRMLG